MFRLVILPAVLVALVIDVTAIDSQRINSRTSTVHQYYSGFQDNKPSDPFGADVDYYGQNRQRDVDHPASDGSKPQQDWAGDTNPYSKSLEGQNDGSNYHYPQPEVRQPDSSAGSYGYQQYYPIQQKHSYGPSKTKSKGKDKDLLWEIFEHFFDKKKELEDHILDLFLTKGHKGHGEPPSGYHYQEDKGQSKVDIFKKVKFLAIAATVMLTLLGSGIVLAPLVIGKGRRRSLFLPPNISLPSATDIGQLAGNVLRAIDRFQQYQGEGTL